MRPPPSFCSIVSAALVPGSCSSHDGKHAVTSCRSHARLSPRGRLALLPIHLPQHPDEHRPKSPVLLAVDQEFGEGWVRDRVRPPPRVCRVWKRMLIPVDLRPVAGCFERFGTVATTSDLPWMPSGRPQRIAKPPCPRRLVVGYARPAFLAPRSSRPVPAPRQECEHWDSETCSVMARSSALLARNEI
jgi:hypothetical protein